MNSEQEIIQFFIALLSHEKIHMDINIEVKKRVLDYIIRRIQEDEKL